MTAVSFLSHANIRQPGSVWRAIGLVVSTPDFHRTHHSVDRDDCNSNFGLMLSCWDRLFGTYRSAPALGHENIRFGVEGYHGTGWNVDSQDARRSVRAGARERSSPALAAIAPSPIGVPDTNTPRNPTKRRRRAVQSDGGARLAAADPERNWTQGMGHYLRGLCQRRHGTLAARGMGGAARDAERHDQAFRRARSPKRSSYGASRAANGRAS
jgi:hypothetical protein